MSLISADALLSRIGDPDLRLADVRWWLADPPKGRRDYEDGHVPGAVFVDLDTDLVAVDGPGRHPLPDPAAFLRRMEALGFDSASHIVVYDDAGGTVAARLWWMLEDLGHPRVQVLDGGIQAWVEAGGPITTSVPPSALGRLDLRKQWSRTIDKAALIARLGTVAGHIPTAISRPTAGNLGPDGRLLAPIELRARFETLGKEVVVACGSGVNACHNALAMRVAGLPDPLLYPGSYSDWSRSGMPVATGDEPGEVPPSLRR
jgi:thiosulfate/3-mercaptopyruvate sulfurtransferase